jgi:hypothetical protein
MPSSCRGVKRGGMPKPFFRSRSRIAQQLVVDGQHQRVVAGGGGALGQFAGEAAVAVDEHLHPARRRAEGGQGLERAYRAVAEAIRGPRRGRRARRRQLAIGPEQTGQAGRADQQGHRKSLAEQGQRQVPWPRLARHAAAPPLTPARCGAAATPFRRRRRRSRTRDAAVLPAQVRAGRRCCSRRVARREGWSWNPRCSPQRAGFGSFARSGGVPHARMIVPARSRERDILRAVQ